MIIHLTGADTYRSAQRLSELRAAFIKRHDPRGLNVVVLDSGQATRQTLHAAVTATGFFAAKRFVVVDHYTGDGKLAPEELAAELAPFVDKDHDVIVVLRDVSLTGANTQKKKGRSARKSNAVLVLPNEKLEEFPTLNGPSAMAWLQKRAVANGGRFDPAALQRVVALTNLDSWRMAAEADKLIAYAGDRPVTLADVEQMVVSEYGSDIFALTDALGHRQTARALELLHRELAIGASPFALVSTIAGHVRNLWQVKRAQERGLSSASIAGQLELHPYVVQKAVAQTGRFTTEQLQRLHHRLVSIDHDLKSTSLDAETLLDLLLTES